METLQCCPLCGEEARTPVLGRESDIFTVVRCTACKTVYASARFDHDDLDEKYYGPSIAAPTRMQLARKRKMFELYNRRASGRLAAPVPGARALDIGCNNGAMLDILREVGYAVEGLEHSETLAAVPRQRHEVHVIDPCNPHAELGGKYELILLSHVFEHMIRPMAVLRFVQRHLAPGGVVVLEVPNWRDPARSLWGRFFRPLELGDHVVFYERSSLRRALEGAGLHVRTVWSQPQGASLVMPSVLSGADLGISLLRGSQGGVAHVSSPRLQGTQISGALRHWALRMLDRLDPWLERATSPDSILGANLIAVASLDRRNLH